MGRLVEAAHRFGGQVGKEAQQWRGDFLSKKQVAARYGVCERTVERMMRKRGLPYMKVSAKLVRFSLPALEVWERGQTWLVA